MNNIEDSLQIVLVGLSNTIVGLWCVVPKMDNAFAMSSFGSKEEALIELELKNPRIKVAGDVTERFKPTIEAHMSAPAISIEWILKLDGLDRYWRDRAVAWCNINQAFTKFVKNTYYGWPLK